MKRGFHQIEHNLSGLTDYEQYIDNLIKDGVEGIVVNHPWTDGYLNEEEGWKRLNSVIDYAKNKNLDVWIYDEKGYPSGGAWRYVVEKDESFRAKGIVCLNYNVKANEKFEFVLPDDLEKIIACYVGKDNSKLIEFKDRKVEFIADKDDEIFIIAMLVLHEGTAAEGNGFENRQYINIMDREAVKCFIETTYQRYVDKVTDFSKKIDAVFTDEPCLIEGYIIPEREYKYAPVSWVDGFEKCFAKKYGYDILTNAHRLFEGEDEFSQLVRIHYRELVGELVAEAYFSQINEFCEKNGVKLSGHINNEEFIHEHVAYYGNLFNSFDKTGYIGMDCLNGSIEAFMDYRYIGAKFIGSLARIRGKSETVMVELCPYQDYQNTTDEGIKAVSSMLYFFGANYLNSYWQTKQMKNSKEYSNYLNFMAENLKDAHNKTEIAIYYPIETIQSKYKPIKGTHWEYYRSNTVEIGFIEDEIRKLAKDIWREKLDFEFVDGKAILQAEISEGKFNINGMKFSKIVMPYVSWISKTVFEKLNEFTKCGGTVIWISKTQKVSLYDGKIVKTQQINESENLFEDLFNGEKTEIQYKGENDLFYGEFVKEKGIIGMLINNNETERKVEFFEDVYYKGENDDRWQIGREVNISAKNILFITKGGEL